MRRFIALFLLAVPLLSVEASAKKPKPTPVVVVTPPAPPVVPVVVKPAPPPPLPGSPQQVVMVPPPSPPPQVVVMPPGAIVRGPQAQITVQAVPVVPVVEVTEGGYAAYPVAAPPPPPPQYGAPCLMHEGGMSALVGAIQGESFSSGQLRVLSDAAQGHCFRIAQVAEVLPLFSFEDDKLKALEMMAAGLVDRQNSFRIYSLFTFEGSKERARRILSR